MVRFGLFCLVDVILEYDDVANEGEYWFLKVFLSIRVIEDQKFVEQCRNKVVEEWVVEIQVVTVVIYVADLFCEGCGVEVEKVLEDVEVMVQL